MKPRDIFRIIVATGGLIVFCMGTIGLIAASISVITIGSMMRQAIGFQVGVAFIEIVFGMLIMKGFPPLADIAFPPEDRNPPEEEAPEEDYEGPRCVSCQAPIDPGAKMCAKCGYRQPV